MEAGQIFALVWGVIAIVFGGVLLAMRHKIAQVAKAERERNGTRLGRRSQTPLALGIVGTLFLLVGLAVSVSLFTVMVS
ncbi:MULTISPECIES: hypothetical protein [unclassified Diaminobutyricimonas]|uniref:hypothetical protein n=1 Tax=unclassified Diaminobutyricimonas TaxID=2643261 RepID=UPI0012F4C2B0|nr:MULTISPECIES: hypothetical protein [unclassified Diaminobutyricimonas]